MSEPVRHGEGLVEFAVCGLAFDAYDSGDEEEPVVFAKAGETVTCDDCKRVIDHCRANFKRYRYHPTP